MQFFKVNVQRGIFHEPLGATQMVVQRGEGTVTDGDNDDRLGIVDVSVHPLKLTREEDVIKSRTNNVHHLLVIVDPHEKLNSIQIRQLSRYGSLNLRNRGNNNQYVEPCLAATQQRAKIDDRSLCCRR